MKSCLVPAIESLETRMLFSVTPTGAVPAAPDLTASLKAHFPRAATPGSQIKTSLRLSNTGGPLASTTVPVDVYVSDTPAIDPQAIPFSTIPIRAALKSGQARTFSIKVTVPDDAPQGGYYLLFQINANNAVIESDTSNDIVASSLLSNPVGHYSGTFTLPGMDPLPIEFDINNADSSIFGDGSNLLDSLDLSSISSKISATGKYTIKASGTIDTDTYGLIHFTVSASGQIAGDSISGKLTISARLQSGQSQSAKAAFQVTRSDF